MPTEFAVKLDVDVKAEKEEKITSYLSVVPELTLTQEINEHLPIKFIMQSSQQGFLLGGLSSEDRSNYTSDVSGLVKSLTRGIVSVSWFSGQQGSGTRHVYALTNFWKKH